MFKAKEENFLPKKSRLFIFENKTDYLFIGAFFLLMAFFLFSILFMK